LNLHLLRQSKHVFSRIGVCSGRAGANFFGRLLLPRESGGEAGGVKITAERYKRRNNTSFSWLFGFYDFKYNIFSIYVDL
jgi:hypothetical protein